MDKTSSVLPLQGVPNLLIIAIDLTPVWWGLNSVEDFNVYSCLEAILAFSNLHLMLSPLNEISILGVTDKVTFLFPNSDFINNSQSNLSRDGQYKILSQMNESVRNKATKIMQCSNSVNSFVTFSGAVIRALCYYMRRCHELQPSFSIPIDDSDDIRADLDHYSVLTDKLRCRILVVRAADDNPSQYLSLMNAIFTSQKLNIPIDSCILPSIANSILCSEIIANPGVENNSLKISHSSLFQQASDLTGGIYLQIPRPASLLQYLISVFLPRPELRPYLLLPNNRSTGSSSGVDFRAACFCHRRLVDIGYVCSVCLSVFCEFTPLCPTCHTPFKVPTA